MPKKKDSSPTVWDDTQLTTTTGSSYWFSSSRTRWGADDGLRVIGRRSFSYSELNNVHNYSCKYCDRRTNSSLNVAEFRQLDLYDLIGNNRESLSNDCHCTNCVLICLYCFSRLSTFLLLCSVWLLPYHIMWWERFYVKIATVMSSNGNKGEKWHRIEVVDTGRLPLRSHKNFCGELYRNLDLFT